MHKYLFFFYILAFFALNVSCTKDKVPSNDTDAKKIYVMFSPGGLGDSGYNDLILSGFQKTRLNYPETDMIFHMPDSPQEARTILEKWMNDEKSSGKDLFVLASSDYEDILRDVLHEFIREHGTAPAVNILLFESTNKYSLPVKTMRISIFGASYLAGISAAACCGDKPALVVGANPNDEPVLSAVYGFISGWKAGTRSEIDTVYMSTDWKGFVQPDKAYQKMHDWSKEYGFVFPVAGGTNNGIYSYLRDYPEAAKTSGMDVDRSYLCSDIIGSVLKHIDRLVFDSMTEWIKTGDIAAKDYYGLSDGYAQWLWKENISTGDMATAIRLEKEYETRQEEDIYR